MTHIASILLAALLLMPDARAQTFMTGDEVAKMVAGNTASGSTTTPGGTQTDFTIYFTPDGKMTIRAVTKSLSQTSISRGVWQVHRDTFCYRTTRDIMWICNKFQRVADDRMVMTDGISPLRAEVRVAKGNPAKL